MDANGHDIPLAGSGQRGRVVYWATYDEEVATVAGEEVDRPGNRGATATVTAAGGRHGHDHGDHVDIGRHWPCLRYR